MSRTARLLGLLQILRRRRTPVRGSDLAIELGISLRSVYRDIATLQGQGADIEGEAGVGYQLRPGFTLPPLMLDRDELEALTLGMAWVADRGDAQMQAAAKEVLAKIVAVIPEELSRQLGCSAMMVGPGSWASHDDVLYVNLRQAIHDENTLQFEYRDQQGVISRRTIWPCAIALFDHARVLVAWCEMRNEFRHFRVDRISAVQTTLDRFPRRRQDLLREWRASQGIPADGN